jgi:hypothetical protein
MSELRELTEEHFSEHVFGVIATELERTKLLQIAEKEHRDTGKFDYLCRVKGDQIRVFQHRLLEPLHRAAKGNFEIYTAHEFFLKDDRWVQGWHLYFAGADSREMARIITSTIEDNFPRPEVIESPLMGPGSPQSGGRGTGRKGVAAVGVGP